MSPVAPSGVSAKILSIWVVLFTSTQALECCNDCTCSTKETCASGAVGCSQVTINRKVKRGCFSQEQAECFIQQNLVWKASVCVERDFSPEQEQDFQTCLETIDMVSDPRIYRVQKIKDYDDGTSYGNTFTSGETGENTKSSAFSSRRQSPVKQGYVNYKVCFCRDNLCNNATTIQPNPQDRSVTIVLYLIAYAIGFILRKY